MEKIRYQLLKITDIKIVGTALNNVYRVELKKDRKYLIGICFVIRTGAGLNNYITVSDNFKTLLDKVPVKLYQKSLRDIGKRDLFLPVLAPAEGNIIEIRFQSDTVTTDYDIDIIFMLSDKATETPDYTFQSYQATVPSGTATKWESEELRLNSSYKEVTGFLIKKDLSVDVRVGLKDVQGEYVLDPVDSRLLELSSTDFIKNKETFFPCSFKSGQYVVAEIEPLSALGADLAVDVIFLLQNKSVEK